MQKPGDIIPADVYPPSQCKLHRRRRIGGPGMGEQGMYLQKRRACVNAFHETTASLPHNKKRFKLNGRMPKKAKTVMRKYLFTLYSGSFIHMKRYILSG